jgi:dCMP deaminase
MEKVKRIERAVLNMSIAFLISKRGTCHRAQVGAVITKDHRIISTGYNGSLPVAQGLNMPEDYCITNCDIQNACKHAMHAEANAISFAAKQGISLNDATLYCTHQPCYECAKLIIQAGIARVYYCLPYRILDGLDLLNEHDISAVEIPYVQITNNIHL